MAEQHYWHLGASSDLFWFSSNWCNIILKGVSDCCVHIKIDDILIFGYQVSSSQGLGVGGGARPGWAEGDPQRLSPVNWLIIFWITQAQAANRRSGMPIERAGRRVISHPEIISAWLHSCKLSSKYWCGKKARKAGVVKCSEYFVKCFCCPI